MRGKVRNLVRMPKPWDFPTPKELGFPPIPKEGIADLKGKACAWVPGINPKHPDVDWWVIEMDTYNIKKYFALGGDIKKLIAHFLVYDEKLEPLWNNLEGKVQRMKELGLHTLVGVDYSAWGTLPKVLQLGNMYRSAVTNRDLIKYGFKIISHPVSVAPQLSKIALGAWPEDMGLVLVDMQSGANTGFDEAMFWHQTDLLVERWPNAHFWLWAGSDEPIKLWARKYPGTDYQWVPTRARMHRATARKAQEIVRSRQGGARSRKKGEQHAHP